MLKRGHRFLINIPSVIYSLSIRAIGREEFEKSPSTISYMVKHVNPKSGC